MKNKKTYTRKENGYFQNNRHIKKCFQSYVTIVPKHIANKLETNTEGFSSENLYS